MEELYSMGLVWGEVEFERWVLDVWMGGWSGIGAVVGLDYKETYNTEGK